MHFFELVLRALCSPSQLTMSKRARSPPAGSLHDFTATTLSGDEILLSSLAGKVVVCTNVASL